MPSVKNSKGLPSEDSSIDGPDSQNQDDFFQRDPNQEAETHSPFNKLKHMMGRNLSNKVNIARINDNTFMKKDSEGFLRVIDLVHNENQVQNSQK